MMARLIYTSELMLLIVKHVLTQRTSLNPLLKFSLSINPLSIKNILLTIMINLVILNNIKNCIEYDI